MVKPDAVANVSDADKEHIARIEAAIDEQLMASPYNGINIVVGEPIGDAEVPMRVLRHLVEKYKEAGWVVNAKGFPAGPPDPSDPRPNVIRLIRIRLPKTAAPGSTEDDPRADRDAAVD